MSGPARPGVPPAAGAPRPYHFPEFRRHRLDNGLTVWLVPIPGAALTNGHLLLDAGAATEDEAHGGIGSLTAQLLVTGTRRLDAAAFAEATERLGIEVSSEASWDTARAAFQSLPAEFEAGLHLLAEMVREPRLDPGEFARLQAERLADILEARADPGRQADEMFLAHLYADDAPYRRVAAGRPETVEALGVADAEAHHATHAAPGDAHLVIAGAVDPDRALAAVDAAFGEWQGTGAGHRELPATARGGRRVVIVDRPGSVQSELRIGLPGIDRHDPRYFPAVVMSAILGGVFNSRLNLRLREELGYTYGSSAAFDPRRSRGPFRAVAAVQTEVTAPAIGEMLGQLDAIRDAPPTADELAAVRDFLVGVFPLRFETTGGVAAAIEPLAVYGLPDDWWTAYRRNVEAVDTEAVQRAAQELIRPDELLVLAVGDAAAVRDEIEGLGIGPLEVVPAA